MESDRLRPNCALQLSVRELFAASPDCEQFLDVVVLRLLGDDVLCVFVDSAYG